MQCIFPNMCVPQSNEICQRLFQYLRLGISVYSQIIDLSLYYCNFHGVSGIAHMWIVTYLENRSQFVEYKNCDSKVLRVSCGVPQGSIL